MKRLLAFLRPRPRQDDLRIGAKTPHAPKPSLRVRTMLEAGTPPARPSDKTGIAVLPFTDLTPHPDHPYLADGFGRDVAQVISLNPSFFAEMVELPHTESAVEGTAVLVEHNLLLEGAIARKDRSLNISIRVIECTSGDILWSDRFSARFEGVADLQETIAEAVTGTVRSTPYFLHVETLPSGTSCAAAWALRQGARSLLHVGPESSCLDGAVRLLSHACRLDPLYADAKIGLAETLSLRPLLLVASDAGADRTRRDAILNAAEVLAPSHTELPFIRGLKELDADNPAKAALALERSTRVAAIMIPARIFLSIAEARSGRARAARSDAAIAFKRAGRPGWTALADYARAEAALARGTAGEAEAALEAGIAAAGGAGKAPLLVLTLYSLLLYERGERASAREILRDHWPNGLPPRRDHIAPWLSALPGKIRTGQSWLQQIIRDLSS